jgi:hypothetical protein
VRSANVLNEFGEALGDAPFGFAFFIEQYTDRGARPLLSLFVNIIFVHDYLRFRSRPTLSSR